VRRKWRGKRERCWREERERMTMNMKRRPLPPPVVKKAKGVNKVVVKKNISFDDYKNCVLKDEPKNVKINAIRTVKMMNYSLTKNKLALSNKDDKRVWKNTTSTAWGHWRNEVE
jgi:hypothetical protein